MKWHHTLRDPIGMGMMITSMLIQETEARGGSGTCSSLGGDPWVPMERSSAFPAQPQRPGPPLDGAGAPGSAPLVALLGGCGRLWGRDKGWAGGARRMGGPQGPLQCGAAAFPEREPLPAPEPPGPQGVGAARGQGVGPCLPTSPATHPCREAGGTSRPGLL